MTTSSDVIAGLELALASADAMIERLTGERYAKVTEVIWCMDEQDDTPSFEGQRVNLRMVSITPDD